MHESNETNLYQILIKMVHNIAVQKPLLKAIFGQLRIWTWIRHQPKQTEKLFQYQIP